MFKAIKDEKIIAIAEKREYTISSLGGDTIVEVTGEDLFPCLVYDEVVEDTEHTIENYEQYNGEYILKQDVPVDYQNEQIRQQRQARYVEESDPIRLDYDEALARGEETAETLKQQWLASKDKIREELPYIEEEEDGE